MDTNKSGEEEKLEKELKALVSRMKNENAALNKILVQLKSKGDEMPEEKISTSKLINK
jgi:hypothetical protein